MTISLQNHNDNDSGSGQGSGGDQPPPYNAIPPPEFSPSSPTAEFRTDSFYEGMYSRYTSIALSWRYARYTSIAL